MADTRIAYGTGCMWWDSIDKVGIIGKGGLPCCPHCSGVLFEVGNEAEFLASALKYERKGHPGYVKKVLWMRGKCFKSMEAADLAYSESKET